MGDAKSELLARVLPTVRAILIGKSGMTLAIDDARDENLALLDVLQDVQLKLWERLSDHSQPAVQEFQAYAATVTYHAWSDYLRARHPRRASLKNRLRRFLTHQPKYALWDGPENALLCGYARWRVSGARVSADQINAVRERRQRVPEARLDKPLEQTRAEDWDRLLDALFNALGNAVELDDLVNVVSALIDLKEARTEALAEAGDEDFQGYTPADDSSREPSRRAELLDAMDHLWQAVCTLKPEYRIAYLLNIPGPGKSRGDIETFVMLGLVSIRGIGAVLGLSPAQYEILWREIELTARHREDAMQLTTADERFALLWKYLPLTDQIIAKLLQLDPQQIINRRMLAARELSRRLKPVLQ